MAVLVSLISVAEGCWKDLCVVDQLRGPTLPCEWIEFDRQENCVWLKGSERGEVVGPEDSSLFDSAVHLSPEALSKAKSTLVRNRPWWKLWGE